MVNPDNPFGRYHVMHLDKIISSSVYNHVWDSNPNWVDRVDFALLWIVFGNGSVMSTISRHNLDHTLVVQL